MPEWLNRDNVFAGISLFIAALFGWGFFKVAGFPPERVGQNWPHLIVFMIFLIIPFAKKLDFFQFFSFEAKIAEVKKEVGETKEKVSDVREDVRHVIAQQNALSASVQSMNHQAVTVNNYERIPQSQLQAATEQVAGVEPVEQTDPLIKALSSEDQLMQAIFSDREELDPRNIDERKQLADLFLDFDDVNEVRKINLSERAAILRIRIERELKRLLRYDKKDTFRGIKNGRPVSGRTLVSAVTQVYPRLNMQRESFDVFFRIANAAVHADEVPYKDLEAAVYLGERLLGLLTKIVFPEPSETTFGGNQDRNETTYE